MSGLQTVSMTGLGSASGLTEVGALRIELRSVNGRGLTVKQRLCPEALCFEVAFDEVVRANLTRGTVTMIVERTDGGSGYDRSSLRRLLADLRGLAVDLGLRDDLSLRDLLSMASASARAESGSRPLPPEVAALLQRAVSDLRRHRHTDGTATVAAILTQINELDRLSGIAAARAPEVVRAHGEKLQKRVNEQLAAHGLQLEPGEILRELALFADRADTAEELQRLAAHIVGTRTLLVQGGELGRKLEFLLQELLRETNTLGSKSPDVAMAHTVVAMKSCIDKLKEQAANLE